MKKADFIKLLLLAILILSLIAMAFSTDSIVFWINIVSFSSLFLLSAIQIFTLYRHFSDYWMVRSFFTAGQIIYCISYVALLLTYHQICLGKYFLMISCVFFLINFAFMLIYFKKFMIKDIKNIFYINIFLPSLVILFLSIIPWVMSDSEFYKTFNKNREHQTYEQFQQEDAPHSSDQIPLF